MRSTVGGQLDYLTPAQQRQREREEKERLRAAEGLPVKPKSALWIPGSDEDDDNDIFKL
jgi:hypothetical protein